MKRIICVLLVAVMILSTMAVPSLAFEEQPVAPMKPIDSIEVYALPYKTDYIYGVDSYTATYYEYDYEFGEELIDEYKYEQFSIDGNGLEIKVNHADGTSVVVENIWDGYNGYHFDIKGQEYGEVWNIGTHEVTVSLDGHTATFEIEVVENPVESIEVVKLPEKTAYVYGVDSYTQTYYEYIYDEYGNVLVTEYEYEGFNIDTEGMQMKVNFKDGRSEIAYDIWNYMDSYFDVQGQEYGEVWDIGTHRVTVSFYDCETTFDVEVTENPVSSIEFVSLPLKEEYLECEIVDIAGAKIKVNFKDGTDKVVTIAEEDCSTEYGNWVFEMGITDGIGWYLSAPQDGNYRFEYYGYTIKFATKLSDKSIVMVSTLSEPEMPDGVGATVKVTYSDGTTEEMKVRDVDYRAGDHSAKLIAGAGYIKTDKGIYTGAYACETIFETDKTNFRLTLGAIRCDNGNSTAHTDFDKYFAMLRTDELTDVLGLLYNEEFSLNDSLFSGDLTEENIDAMINTARHIVGYMYNVSYDAERISGDIVKEMLNMIFDIETIDLTLSKNYSAEEDVYEFQPVPDWGHGGRIMSYQTEERDDCVYVKKTVENLEDDTVTEIDTYYAVFESDGRCSYFNTTEKPSSTDEVGGECGENVDWLFDETTGELVISGTGKMASYSATSPAPWDEYKSQIKKLTVEDGVTTIGNDTFIGCENLEEVALPETLTKIGDSAFRDCIKLAEIAIPDAVKSLGHYAFYGCTGLTELRLGNGMKTIGNYAFRKCGNIELVIIPETLTSIGKGAFMDCPSIAYAAFKGTAEQWSEVTVGENNEALISALIRFGKGEIAGDINGDAKINSMDALYSLQHATQTIVLMDEAFAMGDVDGNGKINSFDALLILEISVGNCDEEKPEVSDEPQSLEEIVEIYNYAVNKVIDEKAGYTKQRTTTVNEFYAGSYTDMVSSIFKDYLGEGSCEIENSKGIAKFFAKSTLSASDVTSASCELSGNDYIITLNLADGTSSATQTSKKDSSAVAKSGLATGKDLTTDNDYVNSGCLYTSITAEEFKVDEITATNTNVKIVVIIDAETGNMISYTASFDWDVVIEKFSVIFIKIAKITAECHTEVTVSDFKW